MFLTGLALIALNPIAVRLDLSAPRVKVSPDLYGIFFEEINCAGDGGLYAELVRNRSFEENDKPDHWNLMPGSSGSMEVRKYPSPEGFNARFLRVASTGKMTLANEGYWGISVARGAAYDLTFRATCPSPLTVRVGLRSPSGRILAEKSFRVSPRKFQTHKAELKPIETDPKASLVFAIDSPAQLDLDDVSLFPRERFKSTELRKDLSEELADLKPAFMRFPGGCWVEGDTMAYSQRWKDTIGDPSKRRTQPNLWGYQSTNGLGFYEYLQLCEDLGAAPLFVINCGMSHKEVVPLDRMQAYVQDALDAIEYANGPVDSKWGRLRAEQGHPGSFHLKYMEIGNENGGPAYEQRYGLIYRAIKAKHPEIELISDEWGGRPQNSPVDILDEHYYNSPEFFFANESRYDRYPRNGPQIYVGEYAVTQGCGNGNLRGALAEAAFMMGMERNSDVVKMASYAPLFANLNHKTWNPDLIYFDSSRVCGTPSYEVQKLMAASRPEEMIRCKLSASGETLSAFESGGIGVGTWHTAAEFKDIRVVSEGREVLASLDGKGLTPELGTWRSGADGLAQTSDGEPTRAFARGNWSRCTLTLKARKTGLAEGFLINVGYRDDQNCAWVNFGGWGNKLAALEVTRNGSKSIVGRQVPNTIETGRWYDIRIDYSPERVRCFLDGKLLINEPAPATRTIFANAGTRGKNWVVKLLNSGDEGQDFSLDLGQLGWSSASGEVATISGQNTDENTLDQPHKIRAARAKLKSNARTLIFHAMPRSLNVLTLRQP